VLRVRDVESPGMPPGYGIAGGTPLESTCIAALQTVVTYLTEALGVRSPRVALFGLAAVTIGLCLHCLGICRICASCSMPFLFVQWPAEDVVLMGRSIGTGVAAGVAAESPGLGAHICICAHDNSGMLCSKTKPAK
jgi:hypothetical protein